MRNSVANLIGKFAHASLAPKDIFKFKSAKRKLKREWNTLGRHDRYLPRRKMEDAL